MKKVKWLVVPAAGFLAHIPFSILGLVENSAQTLGIGIALVLPSVAGMVIATAFAIFKYRLYDIDLIINRTLVYGTLTAGVVALYALVVGGMGVLFQSGGNLTMALIATGLVAVLFQPLRQRLQRAVNHLMYGARDEPFEALAQLGRRLETAVTIEAPTLLPPLPAAVEVAAYRIVQEALKNAVEHGCADNCLVGLALDGNLCLTIADDGLGLPDTVTPGVGLVSMRERAEELGGTFKIRPRPGDGTKVKVSLPLELGG